MARLHVIKEITTLLDRSHDLAYGVTTPTDSQAAQAFALEAIGRALVELLIQQDRRPS